MSVTFQPVSLAPQDEDPMVNMANGNAAEVLVLLGLDAADPCGEDDAASFLGRVLLARALLSSDGARAKSEHGRWITMPREAGYLTRRLGELQDLAEHCAAAGLTVCWG
ncbi:hypothetical protein [Kitasatospora sp. NPDC093679]|uniref:hypothetical protein n=1 Tax=Kitasatospora sp. NPDC093679 TaxID=3154983 RepID=UPI003438C88D